MKKKVAGVIFGISFMLCGCGVENLLGTVEQKAGFIALVVIMAISAVMAR